MSYDEWMTDPKWIEKVRAAMGSIDLDPASNDIAQEYIKAARYYTIETNGLNKPWYGNVYCNPPYSKGKIDDFTKKILDEWNYSRSMIPMPRPRQMIILVNSQTDTAWYQLLMRACTVALLVRKRIKFWKIFDGKAWPKWESTTVKGKIGNSPRFLNTLFYFGDNINSFLKTFRNDGIFVEPLDLTEGVYNLLK